MLPQTTLDNLHSFLSVIVSFSFKAVKTIYNIPNAQIRYYLCEDLFSV